jgi:hypothetical protein
MNEPTIVVRVSAREREPDLVVAQVMLPSPCVLTAEEITGILLSANRAKTHGNAEVSFVFHQMGSVVRIVKDFRRTAVRNLERAGVPRSSAMKLVGHRTESVYRRYAIVNESMLGEAAAKLSALHQAEEAEPRRVLPLGGRAS